MTQVLLDDELCRQAQALGHHANFQDAVREALERYIRHLRQQEILSEFGQIEYREDYDYKAQRAIR